MIFRLLLREEIALIWEIDRAEVIDHVYHLRDGQLVLGPEHFNMRGWPPGEAALYTPILLDCYDRGGTFLAAFDGPRLAGVMVLENHWIGRAQDTLQLKFLHVSRPDRGQGLGNALFQKAAELARERGAAKLYVSATPSEHTIDFYFRQGCVLAAEPDPELWALEPEDIHLECAL